MDRTRALSSERLFVEFKGPSTLQVGANRLVFTLKDALGEKAITAGDLAITHERKLHLVIYDSSLREFQHLHPEPYGSDWQVEANFSVNGNYWAWMQGELAWREDQKFNLLTNFQIVGGPSAHPLPPILPVTLTGSSGNSVITLRSPPAMAGAMVMATVTFSRNDGTQPEITEFLGARAHALVVPARADKVIHAHPMDGGEDTNEAMFDIDFEDSGDHRVWVQYIDGGVLRVIPLAMRALASTNEPSSPPAPSGPPQATVRFRRDLIPIMNNKCLSCHSASEYAPLPSGNCRGWVSFEDRPLGAVHPVTGNPTGCPNLTLYERLMTTPWQCNAQTRYVVPSNPEMSYFYRKLTGTSLCEKSPGSQSAKMPPPGYPQLTSSELELFRRWIADGALDN